MNKAKLVAKIWHVFRHTPCRFVYVHKKGKTWHLSRKDKPVVSAVKFMLERKKRTKMTYEGIENAVDTATRACLYRGVV